MAIGASHLIDMMIDLENAAADLYAYYHSIFTEDAEFWWELMMEEKNHASLIRGGRDALLDHEMMPAQLLVSTEDELREAIETVRHLLGTYDETQPTRREALETAFRLENSAGEIHFQEAMAQSSKSFILQLLQQLNQDDKDHGCRIREYMNSQGL